MKTLKEKIIGLLSAGKSPKEIALICNCSYGYVKRVEGECDYVVDSEPSVCVSNNLSSNYQEWFAKEWNAAVSKLRRCEK